MTPGKGFLTALVALVGVLLVYLAISGRYVNAGAALGSIPVLPSGGATLAGLFTSQGGSASSGQQDPLNRSAGQTSSTSPTSQAPSSPGRQPPFTQPAG